MNSTGRRAPFVLLAEDDLDDQEFLKEALLNEDASLHLECINNGRKLIDYLHVLPPEEFPDIIVLDYNIPELSGIEILKILNADQRYATIPKIVWSTSGSPLFKSQSIEMGVMDYITKPSDLNSFIAVAKRIISFIQHEE